MASNAAMISAVDGWQESEYTVGAFASRDLGKLRKTSVRILVVTSDLPIASQNGYHFSHPSRLKILSYLLVVAESRSCYIRRNCQIAILCVYDLVLNR
jgi:hypothetical protein